MCLKSKCTAPHILLPVVNRSKVIAISNKVKNKPVHYFSSYCLKDVMVSQFWTVYLKNRIKSHNRRRHAANAITLPMACGSKWLSTIFYYRSPVSPGFWPLIGFSSRQPWDMYLYLFGLICTHVIKMLLYPIIRSSVPTYIIWRSVS